MEKFHSSLIDKSKKIGVLCGGMSNEREVSLRSGKNCFEALKRLGFENTEIIDVDRNIAKTLIEKKIEVAYIALHGKYGEDGCIQGLLEVIGIPYTGSGVKASAIAMDKEFTKRILDTQKLPIIPSIVVNTFNELKDKEINLNYPLMIKPVSEGSSIGMKKVNTPDELESAIIDAEKYNTGVMLEEYLDGKSITVGVLDLEKETIATPILEFQTKTEWYDYEAKYTEGMTKFILPAEIDENLTKKIQDLSIKSHKAIEAKGMSRVDFVVTKEGIPFILEINTIPGMTDLSDLPAQSKAMGISYDELVQIILNSAST
ncbi:MAG: D-alanine--D-alanine ligase [bacterium]